MSKKLSANDVSRLLTDPSVDTRAATAAKVAVTFDEPSLSAAERSEAENVIRLFARDAAVVVRQALAEQVKESKRLPHDVALTLARDVEQVAMPVLQFSDVLNDGDLIEIVRDRSPEKQTAIARRKTVSEIVSQALVSDGHEEAVVVLAANEGADLREGDLNKLIDKHGKSERIQASLARRQRMPATVVERLFTLVSDNLRGQLLSRRELPASLVNDLVKTAREKATVGTLSFRSESEVERLVKHLHANGRLTPSIIIRAMCMGDLAFFESAIAVLAKVPVANTRMLIHDGGVLGLKAIYGAAEMPPQYFSAVRAAIDVAAETQYDGKPQDRERYRRRMIERVLTQVEDIGADTLDYLMAKLSGLPQETVDTVA